MATCTFGVQKSWLCRSPCRKPRQFNNTCSYSPLHQIVVSFSYCPFFGTCARKETYTVNRSSSYGSLCTTIISSSPV